MCGWSLSWAAERRCRILEEILRAISLLRYRTTDGLVPLEAILKSCECEPFVRLAEHLKSQHDLEDAWTSLCESERRRGGVMDSLSDTDITTLGRLFSRLGRVGSAEQNAAIVACSNELSQELIAAREHSASIGKTYTSIGFLCGLSIAILML